MKSESATHYQTLKQVYGYNEINVSARAAQASKITFHCRVCGKTYTYATLALSCCAKRPTSVPWTSQYAKGGQPNVSPSSSGVKCKIWWSEDIQAYYVSTPCSKEFVDFIKIAVPVSDRAYDPSTKHWTISEKWLSVVADTAKKVWRSPGDVVIIDKKATQAASLPPPVRSQKIDDIYLDFVKLLSFDALQAAYRKAALELHPDKLGPGGDMTKMTRLNELFTRIKQERGQ